MRRGEQRRVHVGISEQRGVQGGGAQRQTRRLRGILFQQRDRVGIGDRAEPSYRGEWQNDRKHGKGELSRGEDIIYSGEFTDGRLHGHGVYYYENGDVYEVGEGKERERQGSFQQGQRSAKGVYLFHNGASYNGQWKEDRRHGAGSFIDANGNSYYGNWVEDQRCGEGNLVCHQKRQRLVDAETGEESFPKQMHLISHKAEREKEKEKVVVEDVVDEVVRYTGNFQAGMLSGKGDLTYGTGDCYSGMFSQNYRNGRGVYKFKNDSRYGRNGGVA